MPLLGCGARPEAFVTGEYAGELASVQRGRHVEGDILETLEVPYRGDIPAFLLIQQPLSPGTAHISSRNIHITSTTLRSQVAAHCDKQRAMMLKEEEVLLRAIGKQQVGEDQHTLGTGH